LGLGLGLGLGVGVGVGVGVGLSSARLTSRSCAAVCNSSACSSSCSRSFVSLCAVAASRLSSSSVVLAMPYPVSRRVSSRRASAFSRSFSGAASISCRACWFTRFRSISRSAAAIARCRSSTLTFLSCVGEDERSSSGLSVSASSSVVASTVSPRTCAYAISASKSLS